MENIEIMVYMANGIEMEQNTVLAVTLQAINLSLRSQCETDHLKYAIVPMIRNLHWGTNYVWYAAKSLLTDFFL
jgi:hypothetical protein